MVSMWLYALASVATAASVPAALDTRASTSCTLKASGSDDAPAFLAAAFDASCPTVTVPSGTTLSIQSKLNMTGLSNKHIVCFTSPPFSRISSFLLTGLTRQDRKSTRLNSSHSGESRMPSSA